LNSLQLTVAALQDAQATPAGGCGGGGLAQFFPILLMLVVMYFLVLRPQQKKASEHQKMIDALKKGDQVVTRGGIVGRVSGIKDNKLIIEIQEKVRVEVLKSYIDAKLQDGTAAVGAKSESASA
jgi:preprotein translocase subunit YajC